MTDLIQSTFSLGQVLATPGALEALAQSGQTSSEFISRHSRGDWGDIGDDDKGLNNEALVDGSRLFSAYHTAKGVKLWIITEAVGDDGVRCATTILLPCEY